MAEIAKNKVKNVKPNVVSSMALQVCLKGLTFGLNNWIARRSSAAYLGIVAIRFEFILTIVAVLAREGIRRALLRSEKKELSAAWISAVLSAGVSLVVSAIAAYSVPEEIQMTNKSLTYYRSLAFYCFSAVIEAAAEGPLVYSLREGLGKERIWAESTALILKIGVIISSLQSENISMVQFIDAYARGQLVYAISLGALYWRLMPVEFRKFTWPSTELSRLSFSLCSQNVFKFVLGQGDMLIINAFASLKDQGTFAIVSNYGSLVFRMLFQPLEEASMSFFAREKLSLAASTHFSKSLKGLCYLALLFTCFASFFTWPVVRFLFGRKWIEEGGVVEALAAYCWFIGSAGISGFLESLVHVIIDEAWLNRSRNWTLAISAVYCALAVVLISMFKTSGLIFGGTSKFALQAVLSIAIIRSYAPEIIWNNSAPNKFVLLSFMSAGLLNLIILISFGQEAWLIRLLPAIVLFLISAAISIKTDLAFFKSLAK